MMRCDGHKKNPRKCWRTHEGKSESFDRAFKTRQGGCLMYKDMQSGIIVKHFFVHKIIPASNE